MSDAVTISCRENRPRVLRGFTLIELLVVIGIISLLAAMTVPAIRSLSRSNDASQATNLVRSMVSTARSLAISQHRMVGVVFFEESPTYSRPVRSNQTAMQIIVEAYDQSAVFTGAIPSGATGFVYYSTSRQYLPSGVRLAALTDISGAEVEAGDATSTTPARVILFDANGQLITRSLLAAPAPNNGTPGTYPQAYGDWKLGQTTGVTNASSYPGFFLYNKAEYDAQAAANRINWVKRNSSVILVNSNTGTVIVDKGQ